MYRFASDRQSALELPFPILWLHSWSLGKGLYGFASSCMTQRLHCREGGVAAWLGGCDGKAQVLLHRRLPQDCTCNKQAINILLSYSASKQLSYRKAGWPVRPLLTSQVEVVLFDRATMPSLTYLVGKNAMRAETGSIC